MKNHLKILMLTWEFPPNLIGGLSRHVDGLSRELVKLGVEVHVITAWKGGLQETEIYKGVYIYRVNPLNECDENFFTWIGGLNLAMAMKAKKLSETNHFHIIHVHDWLSGAAGIALKACLQIPLLTTIHATEYGRNNGIFNEMQRFIHEKERQLMKESDQIIVCSKYMEKELNSVFQMPKKKIAIIPNGIDLTTNLEKVNHGILKHIGNKQIFSIGRMVDEKGFETLIEAASLVKEKGFHYQFIVAGKGPMLENYKNQVKKEGLEKQISFIGYLTDKEKYSFILESDICVFPSLYEPFGIVALESMFLGKPTIVSNVGGLKGLIQHRETGLLMEPGKAKSLLEQITYLFMNPKMAWEIGIRGQESVKKMYGWENIAIETKQIMEDFLIKMNGMICNN